MKVILLGPPNSKKREWAKKFNLDVTLTPQASLKKHGLTPAIGLLSDYRTELFLAGLRAQQQMMLDDIVFVHSPLDSYAHIVARIQQREDAGIELDDQWMLTLFNCGHMLRDSLKYDVIYRIKKDKYASAFERLVDTAIDEIITELKLPITPIDDANFDGLEQTQD